MLILKAIRSVLGGILLGICVSVIIRYIATFDGNKTDVIIALAILIGSVHTLITNMEADEK